MAMERVSSIREGFELPFWEGVKWWFRVRPKPLFIPRLPKRLMSDEVIEWIKKRPKLMEM